MPKRDPLKRLSRGLRDVDDIAKLVTGRRLMELGAMFMSMLRNDAPLSADDPYMILGVQRTASDRTVKAAFRAAAFDYHPDTGTKPDIQKYQRTVEAYNSIMKERDEQKGKAEPGGR